MSHLEIFKKSFLKIGIWQSQFWNIKISSFEISIPDSLSVKNENIET